MESPTDFYWSKWVDLTASDRINSIIVLFLYMKVCEKKVGIWESTSDVVLQSTGKKISFWCRSSPVFPSRVTFRFHLVSYIIALTILSVSCPSVRTWRSVPKTNRGTKPSLTRYREHSHPTVFCTLLKFYRHLCLKKQLINQTNYPPERCSCPEYTSTAPKLTKMNTQSHSIEHIFRDMMQIGIRVCMYVNAGYKASVPVSACSRFCPLSWLLLWFPCC